MYIKSKVIKYIIALLSAILLLAGCQSGKKVDQLKPNIIVDTDHLYSVVKSMTDIKPSRNAANIDSLNRTADLITDKFAEYGYGAVEQVYNIDGREYKNIIASFGPKEAPRFIVGAHYDVCYIQPGADDNASGVAGLLELARLLQVHKPDLKYRIDFVAYTLEEPPYFRTEGMGSYVHAKWLHDEKVAVLGMVSLEMIGYFTEAPKSQDYPSIIMKLFYPSTGNFIAVVGNYNSSELINHFQENISLTSIDVESLKAPSFITGVDFSDHMNYWKFDNKAIMITDTAFYRNKNYHEVTDTIDTLNFEKMAEVIRGVYWALINMN